MANDLQIKLDGPIRKLEQTVITVLMDRGYSQGEARQIIMRVAKAYLKQIPTFDEDAPARIIMGLVDLKITNCVAKGYSYGGTDLNIEFVLSTGPYSLMVPLGDIRDSSEVHKPGTSGCGVFSHETLDGLINTAKIDYDIVEFTHEYQAQKAKEEQERREAQRRMQEEAEEQRRLQAELAKQEDERRKRAEELLKQQRAKEPLIPPLRRTGSRKRSGWVGRDPDPDRYSNVDTESLKMLEKLRQRRELGDQVLKALLNYQMDTAIKLALKDPGVINDISSRIPAGYEDYFKTLTSYCFTTPADSK